MTYSEEPTKTNKRKVYLINPKFQTHFTVSVILVSLAVVAVLFAANAYFFWEMKQYGSTLGLRADHVYFRFLGKQQTHMYWIFGVTSLLVTSLLSLWGLRQSHRIAGPLYRLHMHMTKVANRETTQDVKFREGDFFPEVADAYNRQLVLIRDASDQDEAQAS